MSPFQAAKYLSHKHGLDPVQSQELIDWYVNHINPQWANEFRHA